MITSMTKLFGETVSITVEDFDKFRVLNVLCKDTNGAESSVAIFVKPGYLPEIDLTPRGQE